MTAVARVQAVPFLRFPQKTDNRLRIDRINQKRTHQLTHLENLAKSIYVRTHRDLGIERSALVISSKIHDNNCFHQHSERDRSANRLITTLPNI